MEIRPTSRAEAIALFRSEVIGSLTRRELSRGGLAAALEEISKQRFRPRRRRGPAPSPCRRSSAGTTPTSAKASMAFDRSAGATAVARSSCVVTVAWCILDDHPVDPKENARSPRPPRRPVEPVEPTGVRFQRSRPCSTRPAAGHELPVYGPGGTLAGSGGSGGEGGHGASGGGDAGGANGATGGAAGTPSGADASADGCGCRVAARGRANGWLLVLAAAALGSRRARRRFGLADRA
jgi:hypothetical protein